MMASRAGSAGRVVANGACGIVGIFDSETEPLALRQRAREMSGLQRHRGPDWSGTHVTTHKLDDGDTSSVIAHERLSIVDPDSGEQPLFNHDGTVSLAANGEIYNHLDLKKGILQGAHFATGSDSEVIIPLYETFGACAEMVDQLDGIFAFVLMDEKTGTFMAARDPIGVISLYWGWGPDGSVCFASEMKAIQEHCEQFEQFPPGSFFASGMEAPQRWFQPAWMQEPYRQLTSNGERVDLDVLRDSLTRSIEKRMMSDVPWGVLLSGGLDSSLVASIAMRSVQKQAKTQGTPAWPLHSFCIGLEGSPDLAAAQSVADFIGTTHHNYTFTVEEALDAVREAVYHLETYDVTTIRAGTPMFLIARKIKSTGVKMVMSGEGADEMLGGYLYFHKAPNAEEFHEENVRKLNDLHNYDCLRANKAMMAWGVEARVPFLDRHFLDYIMGFDTRDKMCVDDEGNPRIEKYILRKAFDTPDDPYLPESVLWRQKEQFSDGVGYDWIDSLRATAEEQVSDRQFALRERHFPINTPMTKEAYFVRQIFESFFPSPAAIDTVPGGPSIACSTAAAVEWDEAFKAAASAVGGDQSGRAVDVHASAHDDLVAVVSGRERAQKTSESTVSPATTSAKL